MMKCLRGVSLLATSFCFLGAGLAQGTAAPAAKGAPTVAKTETPAVAKTDVPAHGKTILLWPEGAPKAAGKAPEDTPTLTIFLPAKNSTRTGVLEDTPVPLPSSP